MDSNSNACGGRRGDDGTTSLDGGTRVEKNSPYMQAIGVVDELNSLIGMAIASECGSDLRVVLSETQDELVALSSELSSPGSIVLTLAALQRVDKELTRWLADLPPAAGIVLPRGTMAAALCFKARATCRTLERELVGLEDADRESCADSLRLPYVNRLSDLLHALARTVNRRADAEAIVRAAGVQAGSASRSD
ncbi:MAG: cob(I)yrinic acid a,c-diamide adenosyltransferase [Rubrivivax sp.]|nr:cob(I)yrinic acid a,c-diamide adenosyltransferase [Rubrivivax sp.]